ncbi:quinone oxidoreductase family protein [Euzebya tangerina]|uniref:quinone oxidoreductase family protein n=1 Tax=Euzebya tangerina TaxID=591198 RepID=UPI000E31B360|nr:NADPH:quinone oxidoreductase family protein [Euzebya tangerina]
MRAIHIEQFGGPEVLQLTELDDPTAGDGEVVVDVTLAGVNYADTHQAENSYLSKQTLPMIPGGEVAGTAHGRRVVAMLSGTGGYAEKAVVPEGQLIPIPDGVADAQALSLLVQGLTAYHLLKTSAPMQEGESVLIHAAAGGVGSLAVQLARRWGAGRILASASSEEKRQIALDLGADVGIDPASETLKDDIEAANEGRKVDVILEMTGGQVTDQSLAALAPFGRMAFFGMASREAPSPVDLGALMSRSRTVAGFWLVHCFTDVPGMIQGPLQELFGMVLSGDLQPITGPSYALGDAAQAHMDMRDRKTTGKVTLDVTA